MHNKIYILFTLFFPTLLIGQIGTETNVLDSVKVIASRLERNTLPKNFIEHLEKIPSVNIRTNGSGGVSPLSFQGLRGAQIALMWNGIQINHAQLGTIDANELSIYSSNPILTTATSGSNAAQIDIATKKRSLNNVIGLGIKQGNGYQLNFNLPQFHIRTNWDEFDFTHYALKNTFDPQSRMRNLAAGGNYQIDQWQFYHEIIYTDRLLPKTVFDAKQFPSDKLQTVRSLNLIRLPSIFKAIDLSVGALYDYLKYDSEKLGVLNQGYNYQVLFKKKATFWKSLSSQLEYRGIKSFHDQYVENLPFIHKVTYSLNYQIDLEKLKGNVYGGVLYQTNSGVSPLLGGFLSYKFDPHWNIKAIIKTIARTPNHDDLFWQLGGQRNLKNEDGLSSKLETSFTSKLIQLNLESYYRAYRNYLLWLPNKTFWTPTQLAGVRNYGWTASGKSILIESKSIRTEISGGVSYCVLELSKARFNNDPLYNNQLPFMPNWRWNVDLGFTAFKCWTLQHNYIWTGEQSTTYGAGSPLSAFGLHHLSISYKNKKLTARLFVQNLTNQQYQMPENYSSPGRRLGIDLNFFL